ncbi:hypothetical protein TOPH_06713 [Tolypocladium ophioglossoides CBS 100239]|uniref:Uncharacterized protein n=1 Tax=Tolypocladium ophioglossoides (strain CBS 100239) TaxID=1163406 RepID=A0A0L0N3H5_TOLOC|nr:hypothetical protein TOPH_06713 [Tolypocladium ophioglossoides CBS 100239]
MFICCTLRVVGGALAKSESSASSIISNVGLSPLILAASGILIEGRDLKISQKSFLLVLLFYVLVAAGIGLLTSGGSALQRTNVNSKDLVLVEAGIGIMTLAWVLSLWLGGVYSCARGGRQADRKALRAGTVDRHLNTATGSIVILSLLPELISAVAFIAAGFMAINASRDVKSRVVAHKRAYALSTED